jgi:hypothetical protein
MNKKGKNLDVLLESILNEDNPPPVPQNTFDASEPETPMALSLDAEVDNYIVRYEKESIPTAETYEDELFNAQTEAPAQTFESVLYDALNEAEEEEEELPAEEPDAAGGLGLGDSEPSPEDAEQAPPAIMNTPQINLQDFARSIARLVNNYDALMNPKNIILNRVQKYVEMNYDARTAKELMEILDVNYSLTTDDNAEQEWPTPYAAGALSTEG